MTLEEMERELSRAEREAWHAADALQSTAPADAITQAELASLLYAAATLVRRAIATDAHQPAAA